MERNIYGVLFDLSRLTEKHKYYFDMIPYLADWGYNTILWHFTDDQGCALEIDSIKGISSSNAFSKKEMSNIIVHAEKYGIEIIPEIETLGHAGYIVRNPEYKHLLESQEGPDHFTICPSLHETIDIMEKLFKEVAELFPSQYVHAGLDEAHFGLCPLCWLRMQKSGNKNKLFSEYLKQMREIALSNGKKTMVWSDMILKNKEVADDIPKDVVICDWHYTDIDNSSVEFFTRKGFNVICCPASIHGGKIIYPGESNIENIKAFSKIAHQYKGIGVIGMVNTVWCPWRNLQAGVLHTIAFGGQIIRKDEICEDTFNIDFCRDFFGIDTNTQLQQAIQKIYSISPELSLTLKLTPDNVDHLNSLTEDDLLKCKQIQKNGKDIWNIFVENLNSVKRNIEQYKEIILSVEIMMKIASDAEKINLLVKNGISDEKILNNTEIKKACKNLASVRRQLCKKVLDCWDLNRFENDNLRNFPSIRYRQIDSLLNRLKGSSEFFRKLASCKSESTLVINN